MIATVQFRNFKALREATVRLAPFNLVLGPNGSGKTSLIQALLRLRTLAGSPLSGPGEGSKPAGAGDKSPRIEFAFAPPFEGHRVSLGCQADAMVCDLLEVDSPPGLEGRNRWAELQGKIQAIRAYLLDHYAIAVPAKIADHSELASNGGNLAAVLADWKQRQPAVYAGLEAEFIRLLPEFAGLEFNFGPGGTVGLGARLKGRGRDLVPADSMSQGTLYLLAILALSYSPRPPAVVCLEEADRGMHPRSLRDLRDLLYRLSYPRDAGLDRAPVQVIATTHSPYLLDQFKDHPEEIVLASKSGQGASFECLADRTDLVELMQEAHLGDLWYSGILGGVPEEKPEN